MTTIRKPPFNRRYKLLRKGHVLDPNISLQKALEYCLEAPDVELDLMLGDYHLTLADGTGWPGEEKVK